jgi:hypothetical protein
VSDNPKCKSGGPACRPTVLICPFARDDGGGSPPTGYLVGSAERKAGVRAISDQEQRGGKQRVVSAIAVINGGHKESSRTGTNLRGEKIVLRPFKMRCAIYPWQELLDKNI